jgi:hypothetical protein
MPPQAAESRPYQHEQRDRADDRRQLEQPAANVAGTELIWHRTVTTPGALRRRQRPVAAPRHPS